jgi:hypothetical protein
MASKAFSSSANDLEKIKKQRIAPAEPQNVALNL